MGLGMRKGAERIVTQMASTNLQAEGAGPWPAGSGGAWRGYALHFCGFSLWVFKHLPAYTRGDLLLQSLAVVAERSCPPKLRH